VAVLEPEPAAAALDLRLFGAFELRRQGELLPRLRTRYGQWLLALLALRHGQPVDRAWLAGTLWPDSTVPLAYRSLRASLADLRRCLGEEAGRLRAPAPHALFLDLRGAAVDVVAFDLAIARGGTAERSEVVIAG
jgi:DNA-binding SARP family transcriptional activator